MFMLTNYTLAAALLLGAVIGGYALARLPLIRRLFIPTSLAAGLLILVFGPQVAGEYFPQWQIPSEMYELWGVLPTYMINLVFAGLFLGKPLLSLKKSNDLDGLIFAIGKSTEFINFMTTTEIKPLEVGRITNSNLVPVAVKDAIIDRFAEFTAGATSNGLYLVASYARDTGKQLPVSEIQRLATEGVEPELVVALLQPHLASIALAEVTPILNALGGSYAELTKRNGKHPRFVKDETHRSLGERLIELELASSLSDRSEYLQVNMRKNTNS